jgi:hypothetical protein
MEKFVTFKVKKKELQADNSVKINEITIRADIAHRKHTGDALQCDEPPQREICKSNEY